MRHTAGNGFRPLHRGRNADALVRPALEGERESPSCGAIVAALAATLAAPRDAPLHLICESDEVVVMLFKKLPEWERDGWIGVKGATYIRALVNQLRRSSYERILEKDLGFQVGLRLAYPLSVFSNLYVETAYHVANRG